MGSMTLLKLVIPEQLKNLESARPHRFKAPEELFTCPTCSDIGWVVIESKGAKLCECLKAAKRQRLLDRIPPEYRGLDLETIEPDLSRHEGQASLIAALRKDPDMSLLLAGRGGTGKSMVGWLLYKRAIEHERPAVAIPLAELLGQFRRYECGSEQLPVVTSEDLRDSSRRWYLFLDEFDKARPTEFAAEQLFLLMDAVYTYRHQLVVTSNIGKDDLRAHWSQTSEQNGASIMRRVLELHGVARKEMF